MWELAMSSMDNGSDTDKKIGRKHIWSHIPRVTVAMKFVNHCKLSEFDPSEPRRSITNIG